MSYMVRIPKDRFSHDQAQIIEPFCFEWANPPKIRINKKLATSKAFSIPPAMWSCWNIAMFKPL